MHTLIDTLTVCVCACVRACVRAHMRVQFWYHALERPGRRSLDREGLLTERQPAYTATSSEGGTLVLAGWEGMTHSGRRATQGIPTQVPSCQKESKTQPLRQPSRRWPGQPQQTLLGPASSACSLRAGAWGLCPAPRFPPERRGPSYRPGLMLPWLLAFLSSPEQAGQAPPTVPWACRPQAGCYRRLPLCPRPPPRPLAPAQPPGLSSPRPPSAPQDTS